MSHYWDIILAKFVVIHGYYDHDINFVCKHILSHCLPEVQPSLELNAILHNGDICEPDSEGSTGSGIHNHIS